MALSILMLMIAIMQGIFATRLALRHDTRCISCQSLPRYVSPRVASIETDISETEGDDKENRPQGAKLDGLSSVPEVIRVVDKSICSRTSCAIAEVEVEVLRTCESHFVWGKRGVFFDIGVTLETLTACGALEDSHADFLCVSLSFDVNWTEPLQLSTRVCKVPMHRIDAACKAVALLHYVSPLNGEY